MNQNLINVLKGTAFLTVGIVILYVVFRQQNAAYMADCALKGIPTEDCSLIDKVIADIKSVKLFWLVLPLVFFMISNLLRALRWGMTLAPISHRPKTVNLFFTVMLGYFTNLGIPRSGEFVRAGSLSKYENIPFEKVMGTVVLDRVADVLCLLIVLLLGLIFNGQMLLDFINKNMNAGNEAGLLSNPLVWVLGAVALLSTIIIYVTRKSWMPTKIGQRLLGFASGIIEGITSIARLEKPWLFVAYSVGIWVLYYLMTYVCFFGFGPTEHLGLTAGLTVFILGTLGIVFPSPGGMGTYHWLVPQGLMLYGVAEADGFSFANIIFFAVNIFCNILFGILALIVLPWYNKRNHAR